MTASVLQEHRPAVETETYGLQSQRYFLSGPLQKNLAIEKGLEAPKDTRRKTSEKAFVESEQEITVKPWLGS